MQIVCYIRRSPQRSPSSGLL